MRQREFFCGCLLLSIAGTVLGAVAQRDQSTKPPDYAHGVTLEFDVAPLAGAPTAGDALTHDVAKQLRQRLDPDATANVHVRVMTPTRVEVWMNYPKPCQDLWSDMQKATADFGPTTLPANETSASQTISKQQLENLLRVGTTAQDNDFLATHPDHKAAIERYVGARNKLILARGNAVLDPAELASLVLARGDIAFRIAVTPAELNAAGQIGTAAAELSLKKGGPTHGIKVGGMLAKWYPMEEVTPSSLMAGSSVVSGSEPAYMLCYDDPKASMTHDHGPAWTISAGKVAADPHTARIYLPFHLDKSGGSLMGNLSQNHIRSALAIVLDDEVLSVPVLQSRITQNGEITMGGTNPATQRREAERMRSLLNTSRLNASLKQVGKARIGK